MAADAPLNSTTHVAEFVTWASTDAEKSMHGIAEITRNSAEFSWNNTQEDSDCNTDENFDIKDEFEDFPAITSKLADRHVDEFKHFSMFTSKLAERHIQKQCAGG